MPIDKEDIRIAQSIERALKLHSDVPYFPLSPGDKTAEDMHIPSEMAGLYLSPNAVLSEDLDGKLNFANYEAQRTFGYVYDEMVGMDSLKLVPRYARHNL